MAMLNRRVWDDMEHRKAARFARNYRDSCNPRQYAQTKVNQYGVRLWTLVQIYTNTIKEIEAQHPDRCIAFVDGEAKRLIQQREATYVAQPTPQGLVMP